MALFRKLATLAAAGEAARQYAKRNPAQAAKYLDQAAAFVDKQTKGRYSSQINGAAQRAKSVAGIRTGSGQVIEGQLIPPTSNGHPKVEPVPGT